MPKLHSTSLYICYLEKIHFHVSVFFLGLILSYLEYIALAFRVICCSGLPCFLVRGGCCSRLLHYTLDLKPATLCRLHSFLFSPLQVREMVVMCQNECIYCLCDKGHAEVTLAREFSSPKHQSVYTAGARVHSVVHCFESAM